MFATLITSRFPHIGQSCRLAFALSKGSGVMEIERTQHQLRSAIGEDPHRLLGQIRISQPYANRDLCDQFTKTISSASGRGCARLEELLRHAEAEIVALKTARDTALRLAASGLVAV